MAPRWLVMTSQGTPPQPHFSCPLTAKSPKEGPEWPGWLLQVGISDPTLWELLTGELQDLLDITGLRGGLPRTDVLLFKSA